METNRETVRVQLTYPMDRVAEPILYHLVADFDLVPNIRRANMDIQSGGFLFLQLTGERTNLSNALQWLNTQGISTEPVGLDGEAWTI